MQATITRTIQAARDRSAMTLIYGAKDTEHNEAIVLLPVFRRVASRESGPLHIRESSGMVPKKTGDRSFWISEIPMTRSAAASIGASEARCEIDAATPYRLDLTVSALRRLSTNIVDVLTREGEYVRILDGFRRSVIVRLAQTQPARLTVALHGCHGSDEHTRALALVRRILGVERTLSDFYRAAEDIPWLWPLAVRMRGVKPPRYPTLWEACVNAIVFQQMSLFAASSIAKRTILALGSPVTCRGTTLHAFPGAEIFQAANDDILLAGA